LLKGIMLYSALDDEARPEAPDKMAAK